MVRTGLPGGAGEDLVSANWLPQAYVMAGGAKVFVMVGAG